MCVYTYTCIKNEVYLRIFICMCVLGKVIVIPWIQGRVLLFKIKKEVNAFVFFYKIVKKVIPILFFKKISKNEVLASFFLDLRFLYDFLYFFVKKISKYEGTLRFSFFFKYTYVFFKNTYKCVCTFRNFFGSIEESRAWF